MHPSTTPSCSTPAFIPHAECKTLPEAQTLLRKYFEKVIELKMSERNKAQSIEQLEVNLEETQK